MIEADDLAILPRPQDVVLLGGCVSRSRFRAVAVDGSVPARAAEHAQAFADRNAVELTGDGRAGISVRVDAAHAPPDPEGYVLEVADDITLTAAGVAAAFYGLRTLQQLFDCYEEIPRCRIEDWPALRLRGAHFCMTRQVPTAQHLEAILDRLAAVKVNLLLIQYREFFPYEGFPLIVSSHAYTPDEIAGFVRSAGERHIQVVPLLQSLSFQEHILRAEAYAHLREQPGNVSAMCPTHPESFRLYTRMAEQLIASHPDARHLHIGGDEAGVVGQCERCRQAQGGRSKATLVAGFLSEIAQFVQERGVTPMMWADMLFGHMEDPASVEDYRHEMLAGLSRDVVAVDWDYWSTGPEEPPADRSPYPGFAGLSHVAHLRDAGFEVVGAPSCSSCSNALRNSIDHELPFRNITAFAEELRRLRCLGMVTTFWPTDATPEVRHYAGSHDEVIDICYRQVRPGLEAHWYSFLRGAECAWSSSPRAREQYDVAFARTFLGTDDTRYPEALGLASLGATHPEPARQQAHLTEAISRVRHARGAATRNRDTVAYTELFLLIQRHELQWREFLQALSPEPSPGLPPERECRLRALVEEREALEAGFREAYLRIYSRVHLEEEVELRFAEERRLQDQLLRAQERTPDASRPT